MKTVIILATACMLSGCLFTKHYHNIDTKDSELIPTAAAETYISSKIPKFNRNNLTIKGVGGTQSCRDSMKNITIGELNSAVYVNRKVMDNRLIIRSNFSELSFCVYGITIDNINLEESERLISSLNSIGAKIPMLIRHSD